MPNYPLKTIAAAIAVVCAMLLFFATYFTVDQNERGVVSTWGEFKYLAEPGLHFKVPFRDDVTYYKSPDMMSFSPEKPVNTYTVDNQEIDIIFTVFYYIPPARVQFIFEKSRDYKMLLFKMAEDRLKAEMGRVSVAHVAEKRGEIRDTIKVTLVADAKVLGVEVADFQLTNLEYTKSFRQAVEGAAAARQTIVTRENERLQEVETAERVRTKARGEADAKVLHARAEAQAIQLRGEAEAKAIRAQAEALQQNQRLVELRKAERWNGELPKQLLSGIVPFMQFSAPEDAPRAEKR
jgi:regulator of protease activity HflC (stomatin/prohibitin superfamily)